MVWPILISRSVTPGAFSAAAAIAIAPLKSKQPNKIRNTARLLSPSIWPVAFTRPKRHIQPACRTPWMVLTPPELVDAHLKLDQEVMDALRKTKAPVVPT
jgi:hypothetical protein